MTKESQALIGLYDGQTACKKNRFGIPQVQTKWASISCENIFVHFGFLNILNLIIKHDIPESCKRTVQCIQFSFIIFNDN